jgi:hypothetical protein
VTIDVARSRREKLVIPCFRSMCADCNAPADLKSQA